MPPQFINPIAWKVIGTYRTCQLPFQPLPPLPKKLNPRPTKQAVQPCQLDSSTITRTT